MRAACWRLGPLKGSVGRLPGGAVDIGAGRRARPGSGDGQGEIERVRHFEGLLHVGRIGDQDLGSEIGDHIERLGQGERGVQGRVRRAETSGPEEDVERSQGDVGPRSEPLLLAHPEALEGAGHPIGFPVHFTERHRLRAERGRQRGRGEVRRPLEDPPDEHGHAINRPRHGVSASRIPAGEPKIFMGTPCSIGEMRRRGPGRICRGVHL